MRILIATMDGDVAMALASRLDGDDVRGELVEEGEEAVQMLGLYDYDVAILDDVRGMAGAAIVRKARAAGGATPLILIAAMDAAGTVAALDSGADDVVAKPFRIDELMARVRAVVRRSKGHASQIIAIGDLSVDIGRRTAAVGGVRVALTGKEYQVLELLALRQGATITKEMMLNHLYGGRDEPELKIIDVFVCKLRQKLRAASGGGRFIETIWGRGYTLREGAPPPPSRPHGATRAMAEAAASAEADAA